MIILTHDLIDPISITSSVHKHTNGAVVTFLGTTRNETDGREVLYLEYEAYDEMVVKMLKDIVASVKDALNVKDISVAHRYGRLEVGEISLVVAASSPHRNDAFNACQQVVDRIKYNVPIWKREVFVDGYVWVGMQSDSVSQMPSGNIVR